MKPVDVLPEITVYFVDTPLEAEEFVWLTDDRDNQRAEALLIQSPTPYMIDKRIYVIDPTKELVTLFSKMSNQEFKAIDFRDFRALTQFKLRNCGVTHISLIAALKRMGRRGDVPKLPSTPSPRRGGG